MPEFQEYKGKEKQPQAPYITFFQGLEGKIMTIAYPYKAISKEGELELVTVLFPVREAFLKQAQNGRRQGVQEKENLLKDALIKHTFLLPELFRDLSAYKKTLTFKEDIPDELNLKPSDKIGYIQYALDLIGGLPAFHASDSSFLLN